MNFLLEEYKNQKGKFSVSTHAILKGQGITKQVSSPLVRVLVGRQTVVPEAYIFSNLSFLIDSLGNKFLFALKPGDAWWLCC